MFSDKAGYGREYPLLDTYSVYPSTVPASDDYYNEHHDIRNAAYQTRKLRRVKSTTTDARRRDDFIPFEIAAMVMIFGN